MFTKILIANRGDNGRQAVAAKPNCMAHGVRAGDLTAETSHVQ
jgi:hypothetical protein